MNQVDGRSDEVMRKNFQEAARLLLSEPVRFEKGEGELLIGFESEVAIYKPGLSLDRYEEVRDSIIAMHPEWSDVELGASQIEIRTPPINVLDGGLEDLRLVLTTRFQEILLSTRKHECVLVRCGSHPFLPVSEIYRTKREKYQLVPDYHDCNRRKNVNTKVGLNGRGVEMGKATVVSLFQSFQVNLQACSLVDSVEKLNYSLMIGPFVLALAANSRYLNCQDTGIKEMRMIGWERSHDVRTPQEVKNGKQLRVGLPEDYFASIEDYFERTARFPFILYDPEHAFQIGIGLHWLDTRIKFIKDSAIVEFRLVPTQPTIIDEIGLMLFWLGRIFWAQNREEELLPINYVRRNRTSAMYYGLDGWGWCITSNGIEKFSMRSIVEKELQRAIEGLKDLGLCCQEFIRPLMVRFQEGTPSDQVTRRLGRKERFGEEEIFEAFQECGMIVE